MRETLDLEIIDSPIGPLSIVTRKGALVHLDFGEAPPRMTRLLNKAFKDYHLARGVGKSPVPDALKAYFAEKPDAFRAIRLELHGTAFQKEVWRALQAIPNGQTVSYSSLALQMGKPRAIRAVANANAQNPVSILVPCHRVIGKDGTLTGYAGGLEAKEWLLAHEKAVTTK